jgi:hypothetical protein
VSDSGGLYSRDQLQTGMAGATLHDGPLGHVVGTSAGGESSERHAEAIPRGRGAACRRDKNRSGENLICGLSHAPHLTRCCTCRGPASPHRGGVLSAAKRSPSTLLPSGHQPCVDDRPEPETEESEERHDQRRSRLAEFQEIDGNFSACQPAQNGGDNQSDATLDMLTVVELTQPREYPGENERNRLPPSRIETGHRLLDHLIRARPRLGLIVAAPVPSGRRDTAPRGVAVASILPPSPSSLLQWTSDRRVPRRTRGGCIGRAGGQTRERRAALIHLLDGHT